MKTKNPPAKPTDRQQGLLATAYRARNDRPSTHLLGVTGDVDGLFDDEFEFLDDIHGAIKLNRLERDVVDTPDFQRLLRLGQLGFVDLVYPTANHTRGTHSLGVCHWSKKLVDTLNHNCRKTLEISAAERALIGLGGLLHDIPHGPFSHDIEKKTHHIEVGSEKVKVKSFYGPYEKHDNWTANPALFVFLMEESFSVLARVLKRYSRAFTELLLHDGKSHEHLRQFTQLLKNGYWKGFEDELLPRLLFHLLVYEKDDEAKVCPLRLRTSFRDERPEEWGLGPDRQNWRKLHDAWYQPFRHDIIGDTVSADLIDYLMRDQTRLGMKSQVDLKLLKHYILVSIPWQMDGSPSVRFRCALDLNDDKRGTFRSERLNDIFRLLDVRHQIHEKAVYHRVVQSAIAMLGRSILIMKEKPALTDLYGLDGNSVALAGDDRFLDKLVSLSYNSGHPYNDAHRSLACKLAERRVYRPLIVVSGDRVPQLLDNLGSRDNPEQTLRQLAAIIDSAFFSPFLLLIARAVEKLLAHAIECEKSFDQLLLRLAAQPSKLDSIRNTTIPKRVIFWTTPYKQLYKDPAIWVCVGNVTTTIEKLRDHDGVSESLRSRLRAGIQDAETKNEALWKFYVFLSDGLFYTGALAKILPNHPCAHGAQNHKQHLDAAERICIRSLRFVWRYWQDKKASINLNDRATTSELCAVLPMFVDEGSWSIPTGISAVKTDQYLHGSDSHRCRDVRYKFDTNKDLDQLLDQVSESDRKAVRQGVRAIGLDSSTVRSEEMAEIVAMLASAPELLPNLVETAARNSAVDPGAIKSLWLEELRS